MHPNAFALTNRSLARSKHCASVVFLCTAIVTLACDPAFGQSYDHAIIQLPTPYGGGALAHAVNEAGDVVGSAKVATGEYHAVLWPGGTGLPVDLGTLGGPESDAWAINSAGWIGGWAQTPGQVGSRSHAFLWHDDMISDPGTYGGNRAQTLGINEMNHAVGWANVDGDRLAPYRAFLWIDGQLNELPLLDGPDSQAYEINESDQIVGQADSYTYGGWRAVIWDHGRITDLGTFNNDNSGQSWAYGINDLGYVVGGADVSGYTHENAFIWIDGTMYNLGRLPGHQSAFGLCINNNGVVVGDCSSGFPTVDAFMWEQRSGMRKLSDLLAPRSGWRLNVAYEINEVGQITGYGFRGGNQNIRYGYIVSPVHPMMTLNNLVPGIAGRDNTLTLESATPGATVEFYYSLHGGGAPIPGCDLQQNALQLEAPRLIGSAVANSHGVATLTRHVPLIARGQTVLFQAVVQNECAISQLVVWQFD